MSRLRSILLLVSAPVRRLGGVLVGSARSNPLAETNARLRAEIARRVITESELKLHARELEKSRNAAQAASRAKSEFLANMSHEIRTPLNAVIGLTEATLETDLNEGQRENLRIVFDAGTQLLGIVSDILDFSKIEARKLTLGRVEFNLEDAIGDTLRSFAVEATRKDVELVCDIGADVPRTLIGDPGRLRQVITNLVANALAFTDSGEVVVRVRREPRASRVDLHFSVEDTGIGIDPSQIERLFDSFEQIDGSASRRHGGTGLGLSICRGLVQLLGGNIGATSVPGEGSRFFFTISLIEGSDDAPTPCPSRLRDQPVLVVDDNATSREVVAGLLRRHGLRPLPVASGKDAIAELEAGALAGEGPAIVLLDAQMPEPDGYAVARELRQHEDLASLEIVMLTSCGLAPDARRRHRLGIADWLAKPVKERDLLDVLDRVLSRAAEAPLASAAWEPAADAAPEAGDDGLRILLVEDSVPNQLVALTMLRHHGHDVTVASDGQEAIGLFGSHEFDVVLMDVQMPLMDGFACTRAIRSAEAASGRVRHVPIIAMTAHALQGDRERCLEAGMDDYVSKPIRREQLLEALDRVQAHR